MLLVSCSIHSVGGLAHAVLLDPERTFTCKTLSEQCIGALLARPLKTTPGLSRFITADFDPIPIEGDIDAYLVAIY